MPQHQSVLLSAVLHYLPHSGVVVDGTLGLGGHTLALCEQAKQEGTELKVIGIDQDEAAISFAQERLTGFPVQFVRGNFENIAELVPLKPVDGVLLDIGISSYQLDTAERGFSFLHDGPLDMRMDAEGPETAADIINSYSERDLAHLIYTLGEERLSRKIAREIVERRRTKHFETTGDLAACIAAAISGGGRIHPATRTFQALRIAVNRELEVLPRGITGALSILAPGGVLVVISFHSLEDRIVKYAFRDAAGSGEFTILTKKPVEADRKEERVNPRSRSAKLRAIQRV